MEDFDQTELWPPVPLSKNELGSMKGMFLRHTKDYLLKFSPPADVRHILNKAKPTDQTLTWVYQANDNQEPRVPLAAFIPPDQLEELSAYEQTEVLQGIPEIRLRLLSVICIDAKPPMITEYGRFSSTDRFMMDDTVTSDLINSWNPKARELLARLLTLEYIQQDEAMCEFYNRDTDTCLALECEHDDEDDEYEADLEKFAMAGDAPEDDEEDYGPLPSQYYEYFVLRQRFNDMITGKL